MLTNAIPPRKRDVGPLDALLAPKSIAVIGASETPGSVGHTLMNNLVNGTYEGEVYPVHLKAQTIHGLKAYARVGEIPEAIDTAVIATPAVTVPGIIAECVEAKVKSAIIISAGFKETGPQGVEREQAILAQAQRGNMRIIGPNCLGVMRPHLGLNATFAASLAQPGSVAFLSQSGALCTAILDWSFRANAGFSAFVSLGSMLDVGWGDLIYELGDDPHTRSIVIYMESIGDAHTFLSAAREVAQTKPIIVIKVGRTQEAAKAAASHTGSLTGSDEVLDAAFRRCGVLRVNTVEELFEMADVLGKQPRPKGPRLAIVTNAGGPGALATDMLVNSGGELAKLTHGATDMLNQFLPPHWSHGNPIDVIGDASPERYAKAVEIAAKDPDNDGVLVILTPQAMTDATGTAEKLKPFAKIDGKPILASWMGGSQVTAGINLLNNCGIPNFAYPDSAARAFHYMWRYSENLRGLYETPTLTAESESSVPQQRVAEHVIQRALNHDRTLLTEAESKKILKDYGIPVISAHIATNEQNAVNLAEEIGYPVVVKLHSETISHKTDVGGVRLNLNSATAVREAWRQIEASIRQKAGGEHFQGVTVQSMVARQGYEIIIGSSIDPQFGPVLLFGAGGQLVEVFRDRALGLPPFNVTLARRLMERTRVFTALRGVRGEKAVNLAALEQLLVRFSQLVVEQRRIKEIEINPLLVSSEQMVALDARVLLHPRDIKDADLPQAAIRPYPQQYISHWKLRSGIPVTIRPIRPEDEPLMVKFHGTLSEETVYLRYFGLLKLHQRVDHERLARLCFIDYDRQMALVAERRDAETGVHEILGIGRLIKSHQSGNAEFAVVVADQYQHQGLGSQLLRTLVQIGREEKQKRITGDVLPENRKMLEVCRSLGFNADSTSESGLVKVELVL